MARIVPTIGHKLWFYPAQSSASQTQLDLAQALDATVIFVHPKIESDGGPFVLNLFIVDHTGLISVAHGVPLMEDDDLTKPIGPQGHAQWMPYQVAQVKQLTEAQNAPSTIEVLESAPAVEAAVATESGSDGSAPKSVTMDQIKSKIVSTSYVHGTEAFPGNPAFATLTFCGLVLQNGFTVVGKSACADPKKYDQAVGEKFAYEDAVDQVWLLEGYLLKEQMYQLSLPVIPQ